jgi:hypothetical protein
MTNLERPILFYLLVVYMKQCQLWHQSLDANPWGASPNSERRRVILNNEDTESHHHSEKRFVGGDLEVHVSWIVAWRNGARYSFSSVYHRLRLLHSQN